MQDSTGTQRLVLPALQNCVACHALVSNVKAWACKIRLQDLGGHRPYICRLV